MKPDSRPLSGPLGGSTGASSRPDAPLSPDSLEALRRSGMDYPEPEDVIRGFQREHGPHLCNSCMEPATVTLTRTSEHYCWNCAAEEDAAHEFTMIDSGERLESFCGCDPESKRVCEGHRRAKGDQDLREMKDGGV